MRRTDKWNIEKRNASVAKFRHLLTDHGKDAMRNAMDAGRSLARLMADAGVVLTGIDDLQVERYRRRYGVAPGLKPIMFAVATGKVEEYFAADRAKALGKTRKRCALCFLHKCRCIVATKVA